MEFHVHIDASLLTVGAMLSQNLIGKSDQPIVYAYKLLNRVEHNYSTIEREVLTMVFALHKFRHYLLGNKPIFYVNHMALFYLVNKPKVSRRVARWLLLILEYDFIVVYKPCRTHVVIDVLSRLPNTIEPTRMPYQTIDASLFYTKPQWMNDVKDFLRTLFVQQKWIQIRKIEPSKLKNGELYIMGQENKPRRCLIIIKTQMVMKKLHERPSRGHFATKIT
jgi:hypothetical protein